jgi:putative copper resistance protein D
MLYVRAIHFAATIMAAGVAFFVLFIAAPAALRSRLAAIGWCSLALCVLSGAAWLVLTAAAMSGEPLGDVFSAGVLGTVLLHTVFGNDWLVRAGLAALLAISFVPLLSPQSKPSRPTAAAAAVLAAALVGSLAWAGHAIGSNGLEGLVHPAADVLHLLAAAAWLGTLPLLALLLAGAPQDAAALTAVRAATRRYSALGVLSVGTLLASGLVNSWYLVGSVPALIETPYGRLVLAKVALFAAMVVVAAVNRYRLTPQLGAGTAARAGDALRRLRRNAAVEMLLGAGIIVIVAALGVEPPASHVHQHPVYGAVPADAAFVHIHGEAGMADVTVLPGRTGTVRATVRLWDQDLGALAARQVVVTFTPPAAGGTPTTRRAVQDADGAWQAAPFPLSQPGNWLVTIDAVLGPAGNLVLAAPVVIEPGP